MSLPPVYMPPFGGCGDLGAPIDYACVFNGAQYLTRGAQGISEPSLTALTLSMWVKRATMMAHTQIIIGAVNPTNYDRFGFSSGDSVTATNGAQQVAFNTVGVHRDPAAWSHYLCSFDTSIATAADRGQIFVDGVRQAIGGTSPALGQTYTLFSDAAAIGRLGSFNGEYLFALLAEFIGVTGVALKPSAFGYFNADGFWVPRTFAGKGQGAAAYGAAGFHLDFADPLDLGKDVSGNSNHWTASGLTADNQVTDTPTNNCPTLNPLSASSELALSNGNLDHYAPNASYAPGAIATTLLPTSGKWVWASTATGSDYPLLGVVRRSADPRSGPRPAKAWAVRPGTSVCLDGVISYTNPFSQAAGDEFHMAYDADAGTLEFFKNGVPTGYKITDLPSGLAVYSAGVINKAKLNFGQRPFAYSPPPDFKTLSTANLPCPAILNPDDHFTVRLAQNGADITDLPWDPTAHKTLVLSKRRDTSGDWRAVDTVNGAGRAWATNDSTSGLVAEADGLTAFTANGYAIGTNSAYQGDRVDYVWRANRKAGFDIIGPVNHVNGAPTTVPHAVGGVVDYAWVVRADAGQDRRVFHKGLPPGDYRCLNNHNPAATDAGWFSSSANDLTLGATLPSGEYIIYAWRGVPGFSAFETHKGTDSTDGFFQPLDFSPRLFITDQYDRWSAGGAVADTDRSPENPITEKLQLPHSDKAVVSAGYTNVDALSNGLKCRVVESGWSESGFNYIDAAWAKTPVKFARAR